MAQTKVKICIKKPITFLVQIFSRKKKRKKKSDYWSIVLEKKKRN